VRPRHAGDLAPGRELAGDLRRRGLLLRHGRRAHDGGQQGQLAAVVPAVRRRLAGDPGEPRLQGVEGALGVAAVEADLGEGHRLVIVGHRRPGVAALVDDGVQAQVQHGREGLGPHGFLLALGLEQGASGVVP
jgi:hypothetical protein